MFNERLKIGRIHLSIIFNPISNSFEIILSPFSWTTCIVWYPLLLELSKLKIKPENWLQRACEIKARLISAKYCAQKDKIENWIKCSRLEYIKILVCLVSLYCPFSDLSVLRIFVAGK